MEMSLSLCDQRTYQKQKNFILMGNFNYHFDEEIDTKGHKLHRKFRKGVEALCRRWRKQLEESVLLNYP